MVELTLGFLVDLSRGMSRAISAYHEGRIPEVRVGRQLGGSTVGIVGYGRISQALAPLLGEVFPLERIDDAVRASLELPAGRVLVEP